MELRRAVESDLSKIVDIYNFAVRETVATFDIEEKSVSSQSSWFQAHTGRFPILVADENGTVCGWGSLSRWSDRCAYADTAELSIYVHPDHWNRGLGGMLLRELLAEAGRGGLHTVISRIAGENTVSIHLHEKSGFRLVGTMREVGCKFNRYIDVHIYQLLLNG